MKDVPNEVLVAARSAFSDAIRALAEENMREAAKTEDKLRLSFSTDDAVEIVAALVWEAARELPPGLVLKKEWRIITRDGRDEPVPWSMATESEEQADFDLGIAEGEGIWPGLAKQFRWTGETPWEDVKEKSDG